MRFETPAAAEPIALVQAFAHNDYEHPQPLIDALAHGFCGVEADIYLVDGELLIAHDADQVRPGRTLETLYLDPLRERVQRNHGRVYAGGPECTLLIDVKSDADATYTVLRDVLARYGDMLTTYRAGAVEHRAIAAIISGNRARTMIASEAVRYAAIDGTLADLDSGAPPDLVPWISDDWRRLFKWRGDGAIPAGDQALLRAIVTRAHAQGRKVRFWAAPDVQACWQALRDANVDLINTDDLDGLGRFLSAFLPRR